MKSTHLVCGLVLVLGAMLSAQSNDPPPQRPESFYSSGNKIDVKTPVAGDLVIAGRVLNIDNEVTGDVLAAGWRVTLLKRAADDVRLAGASVRIAAPIEGDLTTAGGDVNIGPETRVNGRAWIAGSTVTIDGTFDREVRIAAARVALGGEFRRPMEIVAEQIDILPGARVLSTMTYQSPAEARVASGATVSGTMTHQQIDPAAARRQSGSSPLATVVFILHLSTAGMLFFMLFPRVGSAGVDTLRAQPWRSLLIGAGLVLAMPLAAILLLVTIIGAPIGVALGAVYVVVLVAGLLTTAEYLGELEVKWLHAGTVSPALTVFRSIVLGALTLALLRSVLGDWTALPAMLFGLGAYGLWTYRYYAGGSAAHLPAAPALQK